MTKMKKIWDRKKNSLIKTLQRYDQSSPVFQLRQFDDLGELVRATGTFRTKTLVKTLDGFSRLVVDGRWEADPYNDERETNHHGELNSILVVPKGQTVS